MASKRGGTDLFSEPDPLVGNHRDSSLGLKQDAAPWESPNRNRVPNLRSLTRREAFRKTRPFSKPEYRRIMREDVAKPRFRPASVRAGHLGMPEQVAGIAVFICKIESPFVVALPFVFGWNSAQCDGPRRSKKPRHHVTRDAT